MTFPRHTVLVIFGSWDEQIDLSPKDCAIWMDRFDSTTFETQMRMKYDLIIYTTITGHEEWPGELESIAKLYNYHIYTSITNPDCIPKDYQFQHPEIDIRGLFDKRLTFSDDALWHSTLLPDEISNYIIIGDIHGCIDELKLLLSTWDCKIDQDDNLTLPNQTGIILVGDIVDKGQKMKETIDFIHQNRHQFHIVKGNHESYVWKYLHGKKGHVDESYIMDHYDSIFFFQSDADARMKFFELYSQMKEFLQTSSFIVTHSPCYSYELGMIDKRSLHLQRKMVLDPNKPLSEQMDCLVESHSPPIIMRAHFFGHVPFYPHLSINNKFSTDAGCIHGYALGSRMIKDGKDILTINQPFLAKQNIYPEEVIITEHF